MRAVIPGLVCGFDLAAPSVSVEPAADPPVELAAQGFSDGTGIASGGGTG
jgi:hypothetical protein